MMEDDMARYACICYFPILGLVNQWKHMHEVFFGPRYEGILKCSSLADKTG